MAAMHALYPRSESRSWRRALPPPCSRRGKNCRERFAGRGERWYGERMQAPMQWNIDGLPQSGAEHFYIDAYLHRDKAGDASNNQADQAAFFTPCRICCVPCKEVARRVQPGRCFEEVSRALRSASSVSYDGCTMMVESLP
jgi:hypothetical protein